MPESSRAWAVFISLVKTQGTIIRLKKEDYELQNCLPNLNNQKVPMPGGYWNVPIRIFQFEGHEPGTWAKG